MAARSSADALASHVAALQRTLSCVTNAVIVGVGPGHAGDWEDYILGEREPVPIGRRQRMYMTARYRCRAERVEDAGKPSTWHARTFGYLFEVSNDQGRMIVAFHWHPIGRSPVTTPHLHVGCQLGEYDFRRTHVPTGAITLVDVVRFAITEIHVRPLRLDWGRVLDQAQHELSGDT